MLNLFLFEDSTLLTLYIAFAFLLAGYIKGVLGMGMPAILMVMLTLIMAPIAAIPLIVLPMLFVNAVQFYRGPSPVTAVRGYWIFGVSICIVLGITAYNITSFPEEILLASIGIAMVMFAVPSLFGWRFTISAHPAWQVLGGSIAGVLGGLSAVWSPPVVMYLIGRNVEKDEFIGIIGFLFFVGSLTLALALGSISLLTFNVVVPSMAGLLLSLIGFRLGEMTRTHINRELFRKMVLVAFLILGSRMVVISLF